MRKNNKAMWLERVSLLCMPLGCGTLVAEVELDTRLGRTKNKEEHYQERRDILKRRGCHASKAILSNVTFPDRHESQ